MISFNPPPISSSVMTFPSLLYKISFSHTSISSSSNPSSPLLHHFRLPPYHLECHSIHHLQTFDCHSPHHHHHYPLQHRTPVELRHSSLQLSQIQLEIDQVHERKSCQGC